MDVRGRGMLPGPRSCMLHEKLGVYLPLSRYPSSRNVLMRQPSLPSLRQEACTDRGAHCLCQELDQGDLCYPECFQPLLDEHGYHFLWCPKRTRRPVG
mmetsp:Transcript_11796/g.34056  ORF Transcript_11796/g.34056 Transcript_11796/m.34056 type:complete len:98 (+) Transcript_11796:168-461(+)